MEAIHRAQQISRRRIQPASIAVRVGPRRLSGDFRIADRRFTARDAAADRDGDVDVAADQVQRRLPRRRDRAHPRSKPIRREHARHHEARAFERSEAAGQHHVAAAGERG